MGFFFRMELKKSSSFNNELTKERQKCYRTINRFYLILQSPQPVVEVSAFCQMFKHTIHSKQKERKKADIHFSMMEPIN